MPIRRPKLGAVTDKRLTIKTLPQVRRQADRPFDANKGDFDIYDEIERFVGEVAAGGLQNTAVAELATKSRADGVQFVDGSRWLPQLLGSVPQNGGTAVNGRDCVWVRDFKGAVLADWFCVGDGVTDDTSKMQAAIDAAAASYGLLTLGAKRYVAHHLEHRSGVQIYGAGMDKTVLVARENSTYYVLGSNVTPTDLDPSLNNKNMGLFDLTVEGRTMYAGMDEQFHNLWYCGFDGLDIDRVRVRAPRADGLFISTGNDPEAKKRNFNLRIGYIEFDGGGPITYLDTATQRDTPTFDGAKWDEGTLLTKTGGNRNPISVLECENITIDHAYFYNFGHPVQPGGIDLEPENAIASTLHQSVRNVTIGKITCKGGRGNFAALSWVSYTPNSALIRPMCGLTVGEIILRQSYKMYAFKANCKETTASASADHALKIGKISVGNAQGTFAVFGVFGFSVSNVTENEGLTLGAPVLGSKTAPVGDITISDSVLGMTTVNGFSLEIGSASGVRFRNTRIAGQPGVVLATSCTSSGLDFSGATFDKSAGLVNAVLALAEHTQIPDNNRAPAGGWAGLPTDLQTAPVATGIAAEGTFGSVTLTTLASNGMSAAQRLSCNYTPNAAGQQYLTLTPPAGYVVIGVSGSAYNNANGIGYALALRYDGQLTWAAPDTQPLQLTLMVQLARA